MPRKKTEEEIISMFKEKRPDLEYIGGYVNARSNVLVKGVDCGHKWEATPKNLFNNNSKCPKCSRDKVVKSHTYTQEEFEAKVAEKFPDITIISPYKGMSSNIKYKCNNCGKVWTCQAVSLMSGKSAHHGNGCGTKFFPKMTDAALKEDFNSNLTYDEIAKKYGCTTRTVSYRLAALGLRRNRE